MNRKILLHEPMQENVSYLNRTITADVVVTSNPAEAAYYMTGSHAVIPYCKVINGQFKIELHDIGCKDLKEKYRVYCTNDCCFDLACFFSFYDHFYRESIREPEVTL